MSRSPVVTRFAPSPSGALHLGNARTALFSALAAHRDASVQKPGCAILTRLAASADPSRCAAAGGGGGGGGEGCRFLAGGAWRRCWRRRRR